MHADTELWILAVMVFPSGTTSKPMRMKFLTFMLNQTKDAPKGITWRLANHREEQQYEEDLAKVRQQRR